jgi:ketosteroid isomerase-like protein
MSDAASLGRRLVEAFGNPAAIEALLTEDAQWWITPTVGVLGSPSVGRDAIMTAMHTIFGVIYSDSRVDIHAVVGDDTLAAVRFTLHATANARPYENEYCVWVRRAGDRIDRVWEYLDVAYATQQLTSATPAERGLPDADSGGIA